MTDPRFEKKARDVGLEVFGREVLVNGLLFGLVCVGVIAIAVGQHYPVAGVIIGLVCALGGFLWWRFVRPLEVLPKITCPVCGGQARVESSHSTRSLVCPQCGRRSEPILREEP